jgi:hypothetical protein
METKTMAKHAEILIGKFDILATYTYAKALLNGTDDSEAKERGIVAAIIGAKAKSGVGVDHKAEKTAAEKKKKSSITAAEFAHQVAAKTGAFFEKTFLPGIKKLVNDGLTYDQVKRRLKIPSTWGAKISGDDFRERLAAEK